MGTTGMARALALLALSLLAACEPRAADQVAAPSAAIDADIAAARRTRPSAVSPLSPRAGDAFSVAPAPQSVAPPAPPAAGAMPGGDGIGLAGNASPGDSRIGRNFALDNCRPCHVVAADQASPVRFANAPDFRSIANQPKTTPLGLNIWLTNPHPTMPTLRLTPEEASNVIAYIMSLGGSR
jgi:mono/diheme cytochrome c family protein